MRPPSSVTSGFLVVKRFEALYRAFAADLRFDKAIYALPVFGTSPERVLKRPDDRLADLHRNGSTDAQQRSRFRGPFKRVVL